jgi:hypothetical protein
MIPNSCVFENRATRTCSSPALQTRWAPAGPTGKQTTSPPFERRFAFRSSKRRRSRDDDQPLLVAPVEVIRADCLSRRKFVNRQPEPRRTQDRPELRRSDAKSRRVTFVTARRTAKEIERLHRASMRAPVKALENRAGSAREVGELGAVRDGRREGEPVGRVRAALAVPESRTVFRAVLQFEGATAPVASPTSSVVRWANSSASTWVSGAGSARGMPPSSG